MKKDVMKKIFFWIIIVLVIITIQVYSFNNTKQTNTENVEDVQSKSGEGAIGQYYVKIKEHNIVYDTKKQAVLLVKIAYTNNNDEAKAFAYALEAKAYQNGIELTTPFSSYGIQGLDWNEKTKEIKKGVTYEFNIGFYIDDITQNVELEISPFISSKYSQKITKILEIK